jgi:Na+/melibiose symporter-like transporter
MQAISNFFGALAYLMAALFGNYVLIYVGVVIILLFSIIPLFFITEPRQLVQASGDTQLNNASATKTQWGELLKIYFAHAFSWLGIQTMFVYSFAFLEQRFNVDDEEYLGQIIGWMFFILNAVGSLFPIFLLEPLARKIGRVRTHYLSLLTMSLGYFLIAFYIRSPQAMYAVFILLSLGWAAVVSLPFAIMTEKVAKNKTVSLWAFLISQWSFLNWLQVSYLVIISKKPLIKH